MAGIVQIEIASGNINSQYGSGKAFLFSTPTEGSVRRGCKETFLASALKESPAFGTKVKSSMGPARRNIQAEIGGRVTVMQAGVQDGEILKVFAQRKNGGWNGVMKTACVFIRMRRGAALNRLHIRVPEGIGDATMGWHVTGRFEILKPDIAESLGAKILTACRGHHRDSVIDQLFRLEEMAPEISSSPVMATKQVGERVMPVSRGRRALDLRAG